MSTEVTQTVLDHGYVKLVETWGSDERIIEAARMSTNKGFQGWGPHEDGKLGDEKLLRYLWEHRHATPFEMAGAVIEVQLPIFVAREWHRHRTQSYNEMSARYTPLPSFSYIPTTERLLEHISGENKQAGVIPGALTLTPQNAERFQARLRDFYNAAEVLYQEALHAGVPKELARLVIPVGRYTRMRASANLRNWFAFLSLRLPSNAQKEIRVYAEVMTGILRAAFPRSVALFEEGI